MPFNDIYGISNMIRHEGRLPKSHLQGTQIGSGRECN